MAWNVIISPNSSQCIQINNGSNYYQDIYMLNVSVAVDGNNVVIKWGNTRQWYAPASQFASPSGTATQIQTAIATLLELYV